MIHQAYDPFPRYLQIRGLILRWLAGLNIGDKLPTEECLALRFNVSRETIREALKALVENGTLARRPRLGTWLAKPPGESADSRLTGPFEGFSVLGLDIELRAESEKVLPLPPGVAELLKLEAGTPAQQFSRIRCFEGVPLVALEAFFPLQIGRRIAHLIRKGGLFVPILRKVIDPAITEQYQRVEALRATKAMARSLEIAQGAPLLLVSRVFTDRRGNPVAVFQSNFRADRYFYTVNLPKVRKNAAEKSRAAAPKRKQRANGRGAQLPTRPS